MSPFPALLALALAAPPAELKRAKDRCEFGAWADCAGTLRQWLSRNPKLSEDEAAEAWKLLGMAEWHLGDQDQARAAFVNLLSVEPDFELDPFLVPPPIVEFFDRVKKDHEASLEPLRERKRALHEQQRLAEEAKRKLLQEEARSGPVTKLIRVQERLYLFNWMPLGAGQFQNGQRAKGTAIAAGEVVAGLVNIGSIVFHSQLAQDRGRLCTSGQPGCSRPPYTDSDRVLLGRIDAVKYVSAALFWSLYAYGVYDAHKHFVPIVETEISPGGGGKLELGFRF